MVGSCMYQVRAHYVAIGRVCGVYVCACVDGSALATLTPTHSHTCNHAMHTKPPHAHDSRFVERHAAGLRLCLVFNETLRAHLGYIVFTSCFQQV